MKKALLGLLMWAMTGFALAGPNSVVLTQRNAADTGNVIRTLADPASAGMLIYNPATGVAGFLTVGDGLLSQGGVLRAAVPNGPQGPEGPPGPTGADGAPGRDGIDGQPGAQGIPGIAGAAGRDGVDGAPGGAGAAGAIGPAGPAGIPGPTGPTGATGATGPQGIQGIQGVAGPAGTPAPVFNFGLPAARTLAVTTPYQATNPAKPAIVTVSPSCSASLTLSGGSTCTLQARIGSAPLTCTGGTVVATWTNGNTGALSVGLALNQTVGAPYGISLPTGASFILCPTSGTFTVTAAEQSAG